jgi:DNA-binding GntR family transcriptional regulator
MPGIRAHQRQVIPPFVRLDDGPFVSKGHVLSSYLKIEMSNIFENFIIFENRKALMAIRSKPSTLADDAYDIIHTAILDGTLSPGQRLRSANLQAICGMSVSPVREALVRLTAEGFVEGDNHRGARVAPVSNEELFDIVRNRQMLEGEALRLSILNGTPDWESRLVGAHHLLLRIPRERDDIPSAMRDDWEQAHVAFHRALIANCGSPTLLGLCRTLQARSERYRRLSVGNTGEQRDVITEHRDILDAAIARKVDAAVEALRAHYQITADMVARLLHAPVQRRPDETT